VFSGTLVVFCQARALCLVIQHISAGGINQNVSRALLDKFIASVILHGEYDDVLSFDTPCNDLTYFGVLKGIIPLLRDLSQLVQESQDRLVSAPRTSDAVHGRSVSRVSRIRCFA